MPSSIGVNLRVTGHCSQGGRKYMEDMFSVAYQQTEDERDLEYAFFGIFDGHGGQEAATFAKEHLLDNIVNQKAFWSNRDDDVLRAIREGFLQTHLAMWRQLEHWPRTAVGLPSTSGTTASIAFIRRGKIYIGHVGDSSIVLGYQEGDGQWKGRPLTRDHKPESKEETQRIEQAGGKVVKRSGVPRVVWNRPRLGHRGPVRRSTHIDEIPFLAVARSLGDLWSYNPAQDVFVVSPEPDVTVHPIDVCSHRCLILGTDGLWNVLGHSAAVAVVQAAEEHNERHLLQQGGGQAWVNPSKSLVDRALGEWQALQLQADNTSVVTLMLDPPGPPRVQVLLSQRQQQQDAVAQVGADAGQLVHTGPGPRPVPPPSPSFSCGADTRLIESSGTTVHPLSRAGGVAIFTRVCESSAPVLAAPPSPPLLLGPDSSTAPARRPPSPPPPPLTCPPPPPSPCVQSNEVSSSSSPHASSGQVARPRIAPRLQLGPSFKRRHSSGVGVPITAATMVAAAAAKRKRAYSEHVGSGSRQRAGDEDLAPSDAENDRVAWPRAWGCVQKPHLHPRSKAPLLPLPAPTGPILRSADIGAPLLLRPAHWTLQPRNSPGRGRGHFPPRLRGGRRWVRAPSGPTQPMTTRSHSRQPAPRCAK